MVGSEYVISLGRRPDRLEKFRAELARQGWPFPEPVVFPAYDSHVIPCPEGWMSGGPAYCCRMSHLAVLAQALMGGGEPVLVCEDDLALCDGFADRWRAFAQALPTDWEGVWVGQHHKRPDPVREGVVRAVDSQRTHFYIARGNFLRSLYQHWASPRCVNHIDWTVGEVQRRHRVYSPSPHLAGQRADKSDIRCAQVAANFWNPPPDDMPVVVISGPRQAMEAMRQAGCHVGFWRDHNDVDRGLLEVLAGKRAWQKLLGDLTWETYNGNGKVAALWHPDPPFDLAAEARKYWAGPVHDIRAAGVEEALKIYEELTWHTSSRTAAAPAT